MSLTDKKTFCHVIEIKNEVDSVCDFIVGPTQSHPRERFEFWKNWKNVPINDHWNQGPLWESDNVGKSSESRPMVVIAIELWINLSQK